MSLDLDIYQVKIRKGQFKNFSSPSFAKDLMVDYEYKQICNLQYKRVGLN